MTFPRQLTRSILTLCVLTSYLCVPMTGAPGWNDKMNTNVVLDLHSVFHRLTLKQLKLLMSSVNDPNTLRAKLEMLQAQPGTDITDTLVAEAVGKPLDTRQVLVHILGDVEGTSSVHEKVDYGTEISVQKQLELFDSLQKALSDVPLVELQAIENRIKTRDSVQIKSVLVNVQNHFAKLTDDLITSAVKVPALMTLTSVVDTLIRKQRTVGTDPNPQSTQKSDKALPTEKDEEDKHSAKVADTTDDPENSKLIPGSNDDVGTNPEAVGFDDSDLPNPDQEVGGQDQTDNNPSNDNTDAVDTNSLSNDNTDAGDTNHEEFDDGDLPDLDQKGGEQDQTGNNPSNDNTEAVDTNSWGGEYDKPALYDDRVKPMWNSYRQWTTWGYYDHSTRAPHEYIHPEYRSTYRSTHYGRSLVFVTLVLVFLMVAGLLLFRKRKVVEQWVGPHLTKVPRSCSSILKV